jgi:hypothetical protein
VSGGVGLQVKTSHPILSWNFVDVAQTKLIAFSHLSAPKKALIKAVNLNDIRNAGI